MIKFGDPCFKRVTPTRQELRGVAFIDDKAPVGFAFKSAYPKYINLRMEPVPQSEVLYIFFKKIFSVNSAPMNKDWGAIGNDLHVEGEVKIEEKEAILQNIEKEMGVEWRKALEVILAALSSPN